jgi:hypothetical protein
MKHNPVSDFIYQLFALILSLIIVHAVYVTLIRPNADALIERQMELLSAGETAEVPRSIFIVLKDFEQEACFTSGHARDQYPAGRCPSIRQAFTGPTK